MKYSYLLQFSGLAQLLLFVTANPPNPCADPSNYNLVVPLRRIAFTSNNLYLPTDASLALVNGCYTLQLSQYGLGLFQNTQTDSPTYTNINFYGSLANTCAGSYVYFTTGQTYYQTWLTVSNNLNRASLTELFFSGYAYTSDGYYVGFSLSTTPVNFEGHSPAQSRSTYRFVTRPGSECRIDYQNNNINNIDASTNSFTLSLTVDGIGQIDFVVPSNVTAGVAAPSGVNTYHQCTCSGL